MRADFSRYFSGRLLKNKLFVRVPFVTNGVKHGGALLNAFLDSLLLKIVPVILP